MWIRDDKWPNGDSFTRVSIYRCDICKTEFSEMFPQLCNEETDTSICTDCVRVAFWSFHTPFEVPLMTESKGYLIYSSKSKGKRASLPKEIRLKVFKRDNHRCVSCAATTNLSVDHIKPVKHNGTDDLRNLQTLCKSCNSKKGAKYV